ncbi:flippase activity-associated protein Agl23 [Halocatena pleomorpha]|uniref:TIGR03663 family protein n=1 Tax=Halocatena pleomorpha TaxID=1785090 RepID=A0A3P3R5M2_9EURY|nr:flippase activity-associated protein Agl23 [Halocatena pleomorpha]RRJ27940.1 TIGR03663 family protein [Halocatena pleomorpha]
MERPALSSRDWSPSHTATVTAMVLTITILALLARFAFLGDRIAHWDEARVAFWILDYMQTGNYSYSPVIHGPFYHHVNPLIFEWFGETDTAMRIAPAFITGLLPLTALLFRSRLDRIETVALAAFLAFDPIVLYYSRFMRGDPLVGAFMFAGFAFLIRAIDTDQTDHLLAASGLIALGFTTKENAFVYVLCWLGALAVVLDHRSVIRSRERPYRTVVRDTLTRGWNWLGRHGLGVIAAIIEFFVVIIAFYAPRSNGRLHVPGPDGGQYVGWNVLTDPSLLGAFIWEGTAGAFQSFYSYWGNGSKSEHPYLPYLVDLLETIGYGSLMLVVLACLGFAVDRYGSDTPRELLTVAFAWGIVSMFGYPVITDIKAPWAAVHVVLPLMIPAAVGVGALLRPVRAGVVTNTRWARVGVAAVVLLLVSAPVAAIGIHSVYQAPQSSDNELVQYAQPADDFHPTIDEVERIAANNQQGTDVVLYGQQFVNGDPIYQKPSCAGNNGWFDTLPLPWYLVRSDASVTCAQSPADLDQLNEKPPVVIATANHVMKNESNETVRVPVVPEELNERYEGYDATIKQMRTTDTDVVFLIDSERVNTTQSSSGR